MKETFIHSGWEFAETSWKPEGARYGYSFLEWMPADVPGNVHSDLIRHGVLPHPFERMHELGAQWVDDKDWTYRTTFAWAPDPALPRRVLRFEGLDTVCDVHLNGKLLACHDNMFVPLEADVTDLLVEGENELVIDFLAAVRVGLHRRDIYFEREGLPPSIGRMDDRSFVRKIQCQYGWDWGPRLVSCGIWKPVRLIEYASRIKEVWVRPTIAGTDGVLSVAVETEGPGEVSVSVTGPGGEAFHGQGTITIPNVRRWHPLGMGAQDTYRVEVRFGNDVWSEDVGFYTLQLVREPDAMGESFGFVVNERPLWVRGANWIPDHALPTEITDGRVRERIAQAAEMNMNMLRIWGGGMYESDAFYRACLQQGILVWQDFLFACAYYPDDGIYADSVRTEAASQVRRLRNHSALAIWCGNNENHQMFHDRWERENTPPRFYGEKLYHEVLPEVLAEHDPDRPYWPSSAYGGPSPNQGGIGDQHCWDVWHGGDWRRYAQSTARFCSEFGFASSCGLDLWASVLSPADWDPRSAAVRWHDKTLKGTDTFFGYTQLHYPQPRSLEDWVFATQLNQRDALRFGIEHYRRSDFCQGTLIWQLNDCWPTQSWAVLDYGGAPKLATHEVARLYRHELLSIVRDGDTATLWAVNDGPDIWNCRARFRAVSLTGGATLETVFAGSVLPGERKAVATLDIGRLPGPETVLTANDLDDPDRSTWQPVAEPKELRLPDPAPIRIAIEDDVLELRIDGLAVDLVLSEDGSLAPFVQNALLVLEGGASVDLRYRPRSIQARSLAGEHPVILTRGPL